MSDKEVKATEKANSSSMPTLTESPEEKVPPDLLEVPTDLPTEVVLAMLFTNAKRLEKEALAQILTGHTPKGEVVTYIKLQGIAVDVKKGFVLPTHLPTLANTTANT